MSTGNDRVTSVYTLMKEMKHHSVTHMFNSYIYKANRQLFQMDFIFFFRTCKSDGLSNTNYVAVPDWKCPHTVSFE